MIIDPKIARLFGYFSRINKKAYQNEFLLANDVLAKVPSCGNILGIYFLGHKIKKATFPFIAKKLLLFYIKNLAWLLSQLVKKLIFQISGRKFPLDKLGDNPIFIDTYFGMSQIIKQNQYKDPYFPGLMGILDKLGTTYVYVPKISGSHNLLDFFKMLRILKKEKIPVLMEYQLLGMSDCLQLLRFIIFYPFYVIRLIASLENTLEDRLTRFALWDTLSRLSGMYYFRYLYGKDLSQLPVSKIKCISWYENQPLDKCFYKGLRKTPNKTFIYGAQYFNWPPAHLNLHADEQEIELGIVPDKVLVNGAYFLKENSKVNFQVGPSMRYAKVFQSKVNPSERKNFLVLLSYLDYEVASVLQWISDISLKAPIKIKFHPDTNVKNFENQIKGNSQVVEGDIYSHFKEARMVIGAATGALVEAASLGIPVINIVNKSDFSHQYLPNFGKGILWDFATTSAELVTLVEKFDYALSNKRNEIKETANKIKEMFFCEPTEEKIIEAFDLL